MSTSSLTADTPVGKIAAEQPLATRVFARHGIDFCCGGDVPLSQACSERNIDVDEILGEIQREASMTAGDSVVWEHAPLGTLIDHILKTYHRPLDEELPRLEALARKVWTVHGKKEPEQLGGIVDTYEPLMHELFSHMRKEEQILFPMIRQGRGAMAVGPVQVMRHEHEEAGALLRRLRELTDNYTVPAAACATWRALWHGLADLERSLHEHIHLENNILFPRALADEPTA
ncbi:MAG TPA: iron-sulfur cluster repair di-iron protein [Nannocystis exedens]|nr:iron-sulfur cluster repair di-iron protein [Nannocystis exedens]